VNAETRRARSVVSAAPTAPVAAERIGRDGTRTPISEAVAEEVPVALVFNGVSHAVMMATPTDLEDFGLGFALTEGIIARREELYDVESESVSGGIEVRLSISQERFAGLRERRRSLTGRTGCGICGVDSLQHAIKPVTPVGSGKRFTTDALHRALAELPAQQEINRVTHSVHAAAWSDEAGRIQLIREDVGRHNALDKLIGAMAWQRADPNDGFAVITSRCSVEMVQKAVAAGISVLTAISAPTALAQRIATESGLTLVALARADSLLLLTHPQRILSTLREGA